MSYAKELFFSHLASCDRCQLIDSREDLSDMQKYDLIWEDAIDAYADRVDSAWDAYKDSLGDGDQPVGR